MASINMASIQAKAEAYLGTKDGKKKVKSAINNAIKTNSFNGSYTPKEVGDLFALTLIQEILSLAVPSGSDVSGGNLGPTAIEALTEINVSEPVECGDGLYSVEISFAGDLSRPSLNPRKYGGIDNIAALLNNGYTASKSVHGVWHGEDKWSLVERNGANFIGSTVAHFSRNKNKYNIKDIIVNDIYQ